MFKRKSHQAAVSPLPAPDDPRASMSSMASTAMNIGVPPHRIASIASVDTTDSGTKSKRRSGFLGLGRKKDKDEPVQSSRPLSSFSVNGRAPLRQPQHGESFVHENGRVMAGTQQGRQQQQQMHQQQMQQQQMQGGGDFGPIPANAARARSMGYASGPNDQYDQKNSVPQSPASSGTFKHSMQLSSPMGAPAITDPAFRSQFDTIVELISLQPHKTYVASPPEVEMILARTSAGQQPKQGVPGSPNNDWDAVWLQLSGTSLSMWSMKETRAAAARGAKVPPTYFNITESSLELLNPLPPPPHRPNSHPHNYVFSLNTAGSNRLLLSTPTDRELIRWTTGLRLAAWERSRLEEIYTAHLIKSVLRNEEPMSPLVRGRFEGWVRVRIMGGTEWHRLWLVLSDPVGASEDASATGSVRRHSLFSLNKHEEVQEPNTGVPMASFYQQPRTSKNRTTSLPVLTLTNVTQTYAVFPERVEVIVQSNLMKAVGRISGELVTIEGGLRDSGWALIMPEPVADDPAAPQPPTPVATMLRWVTAFHDAFRLHGRPQGYSWDRQDPKSLVFGYPNGEFRGDLFLSMDDAQAANFRLNTPGIRAQFNNLVLRRQRLGPAAPVATPRDEKAQYVAAQPETIPEELPEKSQYQQDQAEQSRAPQQREMAQAQQSQQPQQPQQPQQYGQTDREAEDGPEADRSAGGVQPQRQSSADFRLPPLSFNQEETSPGEAARSLTPITEAEASRANSTKRGPAHPEPVGNLPQPDLNPIPDQAEHLETPMEEQRSNSLMTDATFGPGPRELGTPPNPVQAPHVHAAAQLSQPSPPPQPQRSPKRLQQQYQQMQQQQLSDRTAVPANGSALGITTLGLDANAVPHQQQQQQQPQVSGAGLPDQRTAVRNMSPSKVSPSSPPTASAKALAAAGAVVAGAGVAAAAVAAGAGSRQDSQSSRSQHSDTLHAPKPQRAPSSEPLLRDEPAAMYLMNMVEEPASIAPPPVVPIPAVPVAPPVKSPTSPGSSTSDRQPARAAPVVTQFEPSHRPEVARRPSGARAIPTSTRSNSNTSRGILEEDHTPVSTTFSKPPSSSISSRESEPRAHVSPPISQTSTMASSFNHPKPQLAVHTNPAAAGGSGSGEYSDAAAFMAYADQNSPVASKATRASSIPAPVPAQSAPAPVPVQAQAPTPTAPEARSSFAPSKAAAERRAKAEAQTEQQRSVMNVPGGGRRANRGMARTPTPRDESSDEDEDEEEVEEDEDRSPASRPYSQQQQQYPEATVERRGSRALPAIPPQMQAQPSYERTRSFYDVGPSNGHGNGNGNGNGGDYYETPVQSMNNLNIGQTTDRPRSRSPPAPHRHMPPQLQQPAHPVAPLPQPPAPATRQNVWNANFSVEHGMQERKGTFVQLEEPQVTLTKAFTPGGLLSAGLQDKDDRSAKRQEEVARETGSSLINVPAKPPPPSTGLLGVVAQHESQRSAPGGIGATLTDRDRERRIAEERQRKIDELQGSQMQGGYGGGMPGMPGYGGFPQYPGGMGGMGGYGGMAPQMGYNPYGMMSPAAQQQAMMAAQMAYQQTMYAMSQAGSQMGDAQTQDGRNSPTPSNRAASPFGAGGPMSMYGYGSPMSMYGGFPQFGMGGMPPMGMPGMGSPGMMSPAMQPGMPGWASPPAGGGGGGAYGRPMSAADGNGSPAMPGGSYNGSDRGHGAHEERNAS